ncbi:MAG: hypothetical protein KGJ09_02075 [Candidatus Omnitrophica bacterium]|nr:hypothetical protein [Candidatus Omnitrophota bacterium]MDE2008845.1 hypothetical protein [Candidatus Omnitrophota bacterium]MDE2213592.1 hypothetical protein [Candidatus Omnitrophota bacterium]MDE2230507.1 hypothetical protein [Candidatus Omnitrophota bacterium]
MRFFLSFALLTFFGGGTAFAHPEYLNYFKKESGRAINCSECHLNPEGPAGNGPGQIGSLNAQQKKMLELARQAKPGAHITNPILNAFGNEILNAIGHDKLVQLEQDPGKIPGLLPKNSDLDHDGIPDYQELLDGTNPLDPNDGLPWKLFIHNFVKNWFQIMMIFLATVSGIFGLCNLILWFSIKAKKELS